MKKLIALLFLSLLWNSSHSQEREATIHFIDSTSMKGLAEIKRNKIFFRFTKEDEISKWDHDFAIGVVFSGYGFSEKYVYIKPEKYADPIIMQVIEEGDVNLYLKNSTHLLTPNINSAEDVFSVVSVASGSGWNKGSDTVYGGIYYVQRENEENATDISFSFKSRAQRYFADCDSVIQKIKEKKFKATNIPDLVAYYNNYCYTEDEE